MRVVLADRSEGVGYVLKDRVAQVEDFLDALDRVAAGARALDAEVVRQLVSASSHTDPLNRLTTRECDVLHHMAARHTNVAIAERLHVSQSAVEKHISTIFDKLDLSHVTGYSRFCRLGPLHDVISLLTCAFTVRVARCRLPS